MNSTAYGVSELFWLDESRASIFPRLKNDLTLEREVYQGIGDEFTAYTEQGGCLGIPREFGLRHFLTAETPWDIPDPLIEWPAFVGTYREGQQASVEAIVNHFANPKVLGGRFEAKAGSGKTVVSVIAAAKLGVPTLAICHKDDLMQQWANTADMMFPGSRVGFVKQNTWEYEDRHLVVASAPTLYSRRETITPEFKRTFGLVIYDESHRYAAPAFNSVLSMFPGKRLGISATWRRSDGLEELWDWHLGSLIHRGSSIHVIGNYTQVPMRVQFSESMFLQRNRDLNTSKLITAISKLKAYNEWIVTQVVRAVQAGRKVLVISDRVEQLKVLCAACESQGISAGLYIGETKAKERATVLAKSAIFGSYGIFAEGTDCPALDTLFLATPRADVEQVVGRIQRVCEGKKAPLVVDPVMSMSYLQALGAKRLHIYRSLGFRPL